MTLLLILLGLALIILIARYNEDDKLFWKLLVCFIGGFTAACVAYTLINFNKKSKASLTQVNPTQVLYTPSHYLFTDCVLGEVLYITPNNVERGNLVSQDNSPAECKVSYTCSKVGVGARDQPPQFTYFDTS